MREEKTKRMKEKKTATAAKFFVATRELFETIKFFVTKNGQKLLQKMA